MINEGILSGFVSTEIEMKQTPKGTPVASFNVAWSRGKEDKKKTCFFRCVAFSGTAEMIAKYFKKGSPIEIRGEMHTYEYKDKDGNNRYGFELVVSNVSFPPSRKGDGHTASEQQAMTKTEPQNGYVEIDDDDDLPF